MVARIDLDRIALLRKVTREGSRFAEIQAQGDVILWDSAVVTDLMPMIDRPIANLEPPLNPVLLSHKRRYNDPLNFATIVPSDEHAEAFHKAHGETHGNAAVLRPPGDEGKTFERGFLQVTPELFEASEFTSFAPEYFIWVKGRPGTGYQADRVACFGDVTIHTPDKGFEKHRNVAFYGIPFVHESIGASSSEGQVSMAEAMPNADIPNFWVWISGLAQNLAWCVTHPDQFPITIERGDRAVTNRAQVKAARKAGVDLSEVRVVELRPHEIRQRSGDGGARRAYQYSFPVRGHWRHLPNGESVWVAGYWKATDRPRIESITVERF